MVTSARRRFVEVTALLPNESHRLPAAFTSPWSWPAHQRIVLDSATQASGSRSAIDRDDFLPIYRARWGNVALFMTIPGKIHLMKARWRWLRQRCRERSAGRRTAITKSACRAKFGGSAIRSKQRRIPLEALVSRFEPSLRQRACLNTAGFTLKSLTRLVRRIPHSCV